MRMIQEGFKGMRVLGFEDGTNEFFARPLDPWFPGTLFKVIEAETGRDVSLSIVSNDDQLFCLWKNFADTRDRDLE
jgi:hypothetical protein